MTKFDYILAKLQKPASEPQQEADPIINPQAEPAPEIKPKRERRRTLDPQPTPGRDARARAENWLQALREWKTQTGNSVVIGGGPARSNTGRMQVVGIGSYGGPPGGYFEHMKVHTPIGWLSEKAVGEAITRSGVPFLERLRSGGGPATLIGEGGGWRGDKEVTLTHAGALLVLAVELGDPEAAAHLAYVRRQRA